MRTYRPRMVSPRDVFEYILPRWYVLLIGAILGCVLMVAYTYYQDKKAIQKEIDDYSYNVEDFTEEQMIDIQNAIDAKNILDNTQSYYDRSYIQKVDPFAVESKMLYYKVELAPLPENLAGQEGTYIARLRDEYAMYVSKGTMGEDVAEILDDDSACISELISYDNLGTDGNSCFFITLRAVDRVEGFEDAVVEALTNKGAELTSAYVSHNIRMYDNMSSAIRVDDFYNRQKNSNGEINTCTSNLASMIKKLDTHQVGYYNDQTQDEQLGYNQETGKELEAYEVKNKKDFIKMGAVGGVAGIAAAVMILLFIVMYSKRIISMSDYSVSIGLDVIENLTDNDAVNRATVRVLAGCKKNNISRIAIISTDKALLEDEKIKNMISNMGKSGVEAIILTDVSSDYKELNTLLNIGCAVMAEKKNVSKYNNVLDIYENCKQSNVKLLGVVNL